MKKLVLVALATLLVFVLSSCNNDREEVKQVNPVSVDRFSILQQQEDSLVAAYFGNTVVTRKGDNPGKNPLKLSFLEWCKVVVADVAGGVKGSNTTGETILGSAIVASIQKYVEIVEQHIATANLNEIGTRDIKKIKAYNDTYLINSSKDGQDLVRSMSIKYFDDKDSVGLYHNMSIIDIFTLESKVAFWRNYNDRYVCNLARNEVFYHTGLNIPQQLQSTKELYAFCNYQYDSKTKTLVHVGNRGTISNIANKDLILKYLEGIWEAGNDNSVKSVFTEKFVKIINDYPIPENKKIEIKQDLSIAFASATLWNPDFFKGNYVIK